MQKALLICFLLFTTALYAGGTEASEDIAKTSVQVVDAATGFPLIGADVHFGDEVLYTDPDGFVEISYSRQEELELMISYISYQDSKISLAGNQSILKISLASR